MMVFLLKTSTGVLSRIVKLYKGITQLIEDELKITAGAVET